MGSIERENTCIKGKRNNMFCEKEILFVNKHSERNKPHDAKRRESAMRQGPVSYTHLDAAPNARATAKV